MFDSEKFFEDEILTKIMETLKTLDSEQYYQVVCEIEAWAESEKESSGE